MGLFSKLFGKKKTLETEQIKKAAPAVSSTPTNKPEVRTAQKTELKPAPDKEVKAAPKPSAKTAPKPAPAKAAAPKAIVQKPAPVTDESAADKISADKTSETVKVKGLSGFFDIKKSKDGRYVFNLYASNRVIIATSQIYSSASSAVNGANSVIANSARANIEDQTIEGYAELGFPKWEIYKDRAGAFRFRLLATNGSCICHSQGYTTKASCKNGIESIIRTVGNASIDKNYLKKD